MNKETERIGFKVKRKTDEAKRGLEDDDDLMSEEACTP